MGMRTYDLVVVPTELHEHILTLIVGSLHSIGQSVCLLCLLMVRHRTTDSKCRQTYPESFLSKQIYFRQNKQRCSLLSMQQWIQWETSLLNKGRLAYKNHERVTEALISICRMGVLSADEADAVPHGFSRLIINVSVVFSLTGVKHAICANEETRDRCTKSVAPCLSPKSRHISVLTTRTTKYIHLPLLVNSLCLGGNWELFWFLKPLRCVIMETPSQIRS